MDHQQQQRQNLRPQRHLRSRHRSLASDLFDSETDRIDASWRVSEALSSSDPFVPLRHLEDPSPQPLLPQVETQNSDNIFLTTILPLVCFFLVCYLGHRGGGPPGEEFHRGHLIRQNAERIWAMQARKAKRKEATPEERLAKIHSGVRTMKVVSKDFNTGQCRLGDLDAEVEECSGCNAHNTTIDSKQSTDTADTMPLDCDCGDNDEDVCYICLDGFDVGDTVMFSRNQTCTHVFHEECLLPWLLERRENECPSCRVPLVEEDTDEDNENDDTQSETIVTDDKCCNTCQLPHNENTDVNVLDIESGEPISEQQTTYFIAKGRIIAETNHSDKQKGVECCCVVENSYNCREETCCPSKPLLKRPRALSLASMPNAPLNGPSDLSAPLPLQRVSISLPIDSTSSSRIRNQPLHNDPCDRLQQQNDEKHLLATNSPDRDSPRETVWLDHRNRFTGMQAGFYYPSTSSSEDSSDEDDIIRGIDTNHVGTEQFSSILR